MLASFAHPGRYLGAWQGEVWASCRQVDKVHGVVKRVSRAFWASVAAGFDCVARVETSHLGVSVRAQS